MNIAEGTYEQIRLSVSKVTVTDANGDQEAKLPSDSIKLVGGITIDQNALTVVSLDVQADKSLHKTGSGKYILAPVIHLESLRDAVVETDDHNKVKLKEGRKDLNKSLGMDENGNILDNFALPNDTELEIEILPGNGMCGKCRKVFNLVANKNRCPECGGAEWEILSGKEFMIKEIVAC